LLAFPFRKTLNGKTVLVEWVLIGIVVASNVNIFLKTMDIYTNPGENASGSDPGIALLVLVVEAARRRSGDHSGILMLLIIYIFVAPWRRASGGCADCRGSFW